MEAPRGFLTALIGKLPFVIHLLIPNEGCCSKGLFSFKVLKAECTCLLRNGILKMCFLCGHTIPLSCTSSQFSSVAQSCLTLCDPMDCSTPGLPVHHQLPEFTQTHVHWVGDAIQPSHLLSSPSPPALNLSQHQGLFKWVSSSHQVAIKQKLFFTTLGFPCGSDGKESACNIGDSGSIPGLERSPGEGNGNTLQYSCLENSMDRGSWQATVHGVTESDTTEWLTLSHSNAHLPFLYLSWRVLLTPMKVMSLSLILHKWVVSVVSCSNNCFDFNFHLRLLPCHFPALLMYHGVWSVMSLESKLIHYE